MNDGNKGGSLDPESGTASIMAEPPEPRENMISTAIKFLQNPKVRESPFTQRRAFLEKKGLTQEEIDVAIARSGTAADEHAQPVAMATTSPGQQQMVHMTQAAPVSTWSKVRDYLASAIIIGGIGYALYRFYKKFLHHYFFGPSKEEVQLAKLEKSVNDLEKNITETLQGVREMQKDVTSYRSQVDEVMKTSSAQRGNSEYAQMRGSQSTNEIKDEIKSLKGLLLGRNQFPATPVTQPVLPSWQLANKSDAVSTATDSTTTTTASSDSAAANNSSSVTFSLGEEDKPNGDLHKDGTEPLDRGDQQHDSVSTAADSASTGAATSDSTAVNNSESPSATLSMGERDKPKDDLHKDILEPLINGDSLVNGRLPSCEITEVKDEEVEVKVEMSTELKGQEEKVHQQSSPAADGVKVQNGDVVET